MAWCQTSYIVKASVEAQSALSLVALQTASGLYLPFKHQHTLALLSESCSA